MRPFLIVLSSIMRFFFLFEKSLAAHYQQDMVKELRENRIELKKLRAVHVANLMKQIKGGSK